MTLTPAGSSGYNPTPRASWLRRLTSGAGSDLRYGLRQLGKSRGLTAATLATLALCIGATTAIFSLVNGLMLKPLPFHHPDRLVEVYTSAAKAGLPHLPSNPVQWADYTRNAASFEALALWTNMEASVGEPGAGRRVHGLRAMPEFFQVLQVQPIVGRFFTHEEAQSSTDQVVVLTQSWWESEYAEDPGVVGKMLRVDEHDLKIVGVAPRSVEAIDARTRLIVPLSWPKEAENPRGRYALGLNLYGRLKPGVTAAAADAEAQVIVKRYYDAADPGTRTFMERAGIQEHVGGLLAQRVEPVRPTLLLLQAGVAFVLLIGCVNVANLLLVRSNARLGEIGVRHALGAGRWVIVRLMLLESLVLTGCGAVLGVALAWLLLRVVNHWTASLLPEALPLALDLRVLLFGAGLAVTVGVAIGLVPAAHLLRANLVELMQRGGRSASAGRGARALSSALVVVQVAVALMLVAGAGLLIHSFAKALHVNAGFDPHGVVTGRVALPRSYVQSDQAANGIRDRLLQKLGELTGVTSVALSFSTPFQGGLPINALTLENDPLPPGSPQPGAYRVFVTPQYRETLGLTVVEGRFLRGDDGDKGRQAFVVDETFAKKFFPGRSAVGGRFSFSGRPENPADWATIVGVVRNVPHNGVEDHSGIPFVYQLINGRTGGFTLYLRSTRSAAELVPALRAKLREIDPAIPLYDTGTLIEQMDESFDQRRAVMLLLAAFAGLAMFLSALGIYGMLAYDVSQRTREIGIRGAIGATRGDVIELIVRQGLWRTGIGLVIGLFGAFLLSGTIRSLLFEVSPTDPWVYLAAAVAIVLLGALASYLPARRAAAIDPWKALRVE